MLTTEVTVTDLPEEKKKPGGMGVRSVLPKYLGPKRIGVTADEVINRSD